MNQPRTLPQFALIGSLVGIAVSFALLGLARATFGFPQSRYWVENAMLVFWPSSIMNMPFAEISAVVLCLSVGINALAYGGLGASLFAFLDGRWLLSLGFPIVFLSIGLLLVFS